MRARTHPRTHTDEGYALLTSFLATLVVLTLSLVAIGLALHNSDASALDRDRVRAVHAAEAGINDAMAHIIGTGVVSAIPCTVSATTSTQPAATYTATISYYSTWPIGDPAVSTIPCVGESLPIGAVPLGVVIDSTGTAGRTERRMETAARLTPVYGGVLDKAIFADGSLDIANKVVVDGDVYTNENWACPNNIEINGSFFGQGFAHMSNTCRVLGDLWVNGDVTMANTASIAGYAKSARFPISMSNDSEIGGDVWAKTACNGCEAPRVDEARVFVSTTDWPSPPAEPLPEITFVESEWTGAGYTVSTYSGATACLDARAKVLSLGAADPPTVVRITEPCTLTFENNTTVVLHDHLAIITDGSIEFLNRGVWTTPDARTRDLFLIVPFGTSCTTPADNGHIAKSNNTDFDHLHFLAYSPCRVSFANNNPTSSGQIYSHDVQIDNNFGLTFHAMAVPGLGTSTTVAGFDSQVAFIREIQR